MNGYYNLLSLVLGLVALILPIIRITLVKNQKGNNTEFYSILSFSICCTALCLQFFEYDSVVRAGDWTALMDTLGVVSFAGVTLIVFIIVLNALAFNIDRVKEN